MTADEYVREAEFALRDLPWSQRRDLVAELREHLAELPPDTELPARLGPPDQYAAEMRAAAGLERRRGPIAFLRAQRPRTLVLIALVITVIGLAIGTLVWIAKYQPLTTGSWGYVGGAHDSPAGDGIYYVFHQGKRFQYGMSIRNDGRFTVRVVGVPIEFRLPIKYRLLMSSGPAKSGYGPPPRPFRPFHAFDLKPGEEQSIVLRGVYDEPCAERAPGATIWTAIPVRYSFLWRTETVDIPLNEHVSFVFRKGSACPRAKR